MIYSIDWFYYKYYFYKQVIVLINSFLCFTEKPIDHPSIKLENFFF